MKAIKSIKQAFESGNIIITSISQGLSKNVRIDAKTRYHVAGQDDAFSEWCSLKYANQLARDNYGKNVNEFNCYRY